MSKRVLVRCDGSHRLGMGHVVRCLAVAEELRDSQRCEVVFAVREGPQAIAAIKPRGFEIRDPALSLEPPFDALILDIRDDLPVEAVLSLRERGVVVATIDDPSERRLAADLAFYPPVPQLERMSWDGFDGELLVGFEWIVLRRDLQRAREIRATRRATERATTRLLVTMGGSDPAGMTSKTLAALAQLNRHLEIDVVLGPAFIEDESFRSVLDQTGASVMVHRAPEDMPALMVRADLALAAFGVTAYELASLGVPALYLCLTDDHAEAASALTDAGLARSLGRHDLVSTSVLADAIEGFCTDSTALEEMRRRGPELIDGLGARRIAEKIAKRL